jgi:WD40 repeat protein
MSLSRGLRAGEVSSFRVLAVLTALVPLGACAAEIGEPADVESNAEALTLSPRWTVSGGGPVVFSPSGSTVATGTATTQVQLVAASDGKLVRTLTIRHTANAAAFSPDGSLLAVGSGGGGQTLGLRLFRLSDGAILFQGSSHANGTVAVSFSPKDSNLFASSGGDHTTKLWNAAGQIIRTLDEGTYGKHISAMSFAPDGKTLASNVSGNIHIWRVSDGVLLQTILGSGGGRGLAFSPDGKLISSGTALYDTGTGALVRMLTWPSGSVTCTVFTRNGEAVVVGGEDFPNNVDDATIRYFNVATGAELVAYHHLGGANSYVTAVAISPDGASLGYTLATDQTTAVAASPL